MYVDSPLARLFQQKEAVLKHSQSLELFYDNFHHPVTKSSKRALQLSCITKLSFLVVAEVCNSRVFILN